ncbi:MAG: hypothetical protein KF686_17860 [Ramlibacter sp.]|nr:hypothetical protein [Ramlibacter sp.]
MATGPAAAQTAGSAEALKRQYVALGPQLESNDFRRPMVIESRESGDSLQGDVYAVLEHPFSRVNAALERPQSWCDILILPFNTKYCRAELAAGQPTLQVRIGRKYDQPLKDAYLLSFDWERRATGSGAYLETLLSAADGPLGTHDYRVLVSAVPLDSGRTFLHLHYAYRYGLAGRLAMQAYLATAGAGKVGFTVQGRDTDGQPQYIGGLRGVIERNAMRYYLAIDAYLASLQAPAAERPERRIQRWFTETERYARQLREMDRPTYVALKRSEYERQQSDAP